MARKAQPIIIQKATSGADNALMIVLAWAGIIWYAYVHYGKVGLYAAIGIPLLATIGYFYMKHAPARRSTASTAATKPTAKQPATKRSKTKGGITFVE